jgi:hypothetical protein
MDKQIVTNVIDDPIKSRPYYCSQCLHCKQLPLPTIEKKKLNWIIDEPVQIEHHRINMDQYDEDTFQTEHDRLKTSHRNYFPDLFIDNRNNDDDNEIYRPYYTSPLIVHTKRSIHATHTPYPY